MAIQAGQRLTASVLAALITPDTWHTATLINSWTASGGVAGVFYTKLSTNEVSVTGDIIKASGTGNSVFTVLPAGYIPSAAQNFPASWNNPAASNSATAPWISVDTSGNLSVVALQVANKEVFFDIRIKLGAL